MLSLLTVTRRKQSVLTSQRPSSNNIQNSEVVSEYLTHFIARATFMVIASNKARHEHLQGVSELDSAEVNRWLYPKDVLAL